MTSIIDKLKSDKRVEAVEHDEDGWWIYLKDHYVDQTTDPLQPTHTIHEDTLKEAMEALSTVEYIG